MNSLEYEVLSNLEAGRSMFRPRILSGETVWNKIKSRTYTQSERWELFQKVPDIRA
jgi:hypothetical protein